MTEAKHRKSPLFWILWMGCIVGICPFVACDRDKENANKTSRSAQSATEKTNKPDTLSQIGSCRDLIALWRIREGFRREGNESKATARAMEDKWFALLEDCKPIAVLDGRADLLAFSYEKVSDEKQYRLTWLFRTNKRIDANYEMNVHCYPDVAHLKYLLTDRDKKAGHHGVHIVPKSRTTEWQPREIVMVSREATMPEVPLRMAFRFFIPQVKKNGKIVQDYEWGEFIQLGWQAALSEDE